jgi:hypothetical protein
MFLLFHFIRLFEQYAGEDLHELMIGWTFNASATTEPRRLHSCRRTDGRPDHHLANLSPTDT